MLVNDHNYLPNNVYLYYENAYEGEVKESITISGPADYSKVKDQAKKIGSKATINDFFFFLILAHATGNKWTTEGEGYVFYDQGVSYEQVDILLDFVKVERKVVVSTACLDGDGLDELSADPGEKRIVLTATNGEDYERARPWKYNGSFMANWDHTEFLYNDKGDGVLRSLEEEDTSMKEAFENGRSAAGDMDQWGGWVDTSHPPLDDDGDGVYSSSDGSLAATTYI